MPGKDNPLRNKFVVVLTAVLLAEALLYYTAYAMERIPSNRPLELFTTEFEGWYMTERGEVSPEIQEVLRADDTLSRTYANNAEGAANLFVAFFRTQRKGQAPHSPKNCLPGSGWEPRQEGVIAIPVAGRADPITINRYIVARGENASVVLYWYQSRQRVIASEYSAKLWLLMDSIRYHRSDTALVRVVVPVVDNNDEKATAAGVHFVQAVFPRLQMYLPS